MKNLVATPEKTVTITCRHYLINNQTLIFFSASVAVFLVHVFALVGAVFRYRRSHVKRSEPHWRRKKVNDKKADQHGTDIPPSLHRKDTASL